MIKTQKGVKYKQQKKEPRTEGSSDFLICKTNNLRLVVEAISERIMLLKILPG
jgi:hypothetical protein